jgi:hypothetical protein
MFSGLAILSTYFLIMPFFRAYFMIIDELIITYKNVSYNKIFILRVFIKYCTYHDSQIPGWYKIPVLFILNHNNLMIIVDCINWIIGDFLTFENIKKCLVV